MISFDTCIQSPCKGCSAPCCTFLPLHDFSIQNYRDVDYARYLLNFVNIELALVQGATWRVHWKAKCKRLRPNGGCELHNTSRKPQVCLNYNAHSCFYKPMFLAEETPEFLRFRTSDACAQYRNEDALLLLALVLVLRASRV